MIILVPHGMFMFSTPQSQTQKRRRRPRCYNCRKHGHLSANCTRPRRRPAKKNAKTKLPKVFGRARQCSDPCRLDIDETQETNADAFQKKVIESSPATSKSEPSQVADAPQANSDAQTATGLNEKDIDAINALVKETLTLTLQRMEQVNVQAINDCLAEAKAFTMERTNDIETSFRLTQSSVDVILHKVRGIVNNSVEEAVKRVLDTRLGNGVEVILDRVRGVINHSVKEAVHGVLESRTGDGEPIQECRNLEAAITDDPRRAHCRRHSAPIDRSRRKSEN